MAVVCPGHDRCLRRCHLPRQQEGIHYDMSTTAVTADRVNKPLSPPVIPLIAGNVISSPERNTATLSNVSTPNNQKPLPEQPNMSSAAKRQLNIYGKILKVDKNDFKEQEDMRLREVKFNEIVSNMSCTKCGGSLLYWIKHQSTL